ncbi:hypothetical protein C8J57DRAFT_1312488 [Mycena rebaudengoi]|nr:hypothetical protein C8J57DRAFT_1312488 [Mycena rebaudengoi]
MELAERIYFIMSCKTAVCVDLRAGCSDDGTPIQMWQQSSFSDSRCNSFPLNQLWLVRNTTAGHFSLQNLHGGTYLDLWDGNASNGTKIVGHRPGGLNGTPAANQQWEILAAGGYYWKVRNAAAQTYMNLSGGFVRNGNLIHGWEHVAEDENALWRFERLSVSAADIGLALHDNVHKIDGLQPFEEHDIYFVLRSDLLRDIWRSTHLATMRWRPGIFDHDAFALAYKSAVSKWCFDNIKADVAVLFGVAVEQQTGFAYNWTLSTDLSNIIFIDPANGRTIGRDLFKSVPAFMAVASAEDKSEEETHFTGFF